MSLWLERFGTVELPLIEAEQEIGAIGTRTALFDLPGDGAFDAYGNDQAPRGAYSLAARGETLVDAFGGLVVPIDALRALRGRRDKLYARMDDTTVRWVWARLRDVPTTRTVDNVLFLSSTLRFDVTSPVWNGASHGDGWLWNDGTAWDSGAAWNEALGDVFDLDSAAPEIISVSNDGNATVKNAIITITPGADPIAGFTFLSEGPDAFWQADFTYAGTIGEGQALVLDCGRQSATIATVLTSTAGAPDTLIDVDNSSFFTTGHTVEIALDNGDFHRTTIAGTPSALEITITDPMPSSAFVGSAVVMSAYDDITFGDKHRLGSAWFWLDPGQTTITIEIDSAEDGTATFAFNDGYE